MKSGHGDGVENPHPRHDAGLESRIRTRALTGVGKVS